MESAQRSFSMQSLRLPELNCRKPTFSMALFLHFQWPSFFLLDRLS
nr:MAG TPA: hypothetical protein [Caudoviricetes sp.]